MVKHVVLWKLKDFAEGENRSTNAVKIKKMLENLQGIVPGAYQMEVGINYSPGGYDLVLNAEFIDHDALESYNVNPEHMRIKEFIQKVTLDRASADYMV